MEKGATEAGPSSEKGRRRPGLWPLGIDPFVSKTDHNPRELKSWAKRTGFNPNFSGETTLSSVIDEGEVDAAPPPPPPPGREVDLEKCLGRRRGNLANSAFEMESILGRRRTGAEINPVTDPEPVALQEVGKREVKENKRVVSVEPEVGLKEEERNETPVRAKNEGMDGNGRGKPPLARVGDEEPRNDEVEIDLFVDPQDPQNPPPYKSGLKCDLMENPGFGRVFFLLPLCFHMIYFLYLSVSPWRKAAFRQ